MMLTKGFSLIEALVALAVFALAVMALVNLSGENIRTASHIEARAYAFVVAENRLIEAMADNNILKLGTETGPEQQANREWVWQRTITETVEPNIWRIEVKVVEKGGRQILADVSAFKAVNP
jgi:general secretion pathway protein I